MSQLDKIRAALFGVAVGDALGVPVEFNSRERLKVRPIKDMTGYGTHNQPKGTWSDDSSLTFCLAETLSKGYDLQDLANRFVNWREFNYWTPHGRLFDIGLATSEAIYNLQLGGEPTKAGGRDEMSNGNGSLMRIIPLLFYIQDMPVEDRFLRVKDVSSLTHGHIRSVVGCFIYLEMALQILKGKEKMAAFDAMRMIVNDHLENQKEVTVYERDKFHRLLLNPIGDYNVKPIHECEESEISSSGYVISTLEASFWSFLRTNTYNNAVLTAVNLGSDTDTTGAVTGGLAGLYYGIENIPHKWLTTIARVEDIYDLCVRLANKIDNNELYNSMVNR